MVVTIEILLWSRCLYLSIVEIINFHGLLISDHSLIYPAEYHHIMDVPCVLDMLCSLGWRANDGQVLTHLDNTVS